MNNNSVKIREQALKNIMRRLPYPVTIVTATAREQMRGITIGSFTSLSMEPPLISFNVEHKAQMHPVLDEASHFVVHIPDAGQANLCNHFAKPDLSGSDQFTGISYILNDQGIPVLDGTAATIYCRKYNLVKAGDHSIIIGEVLDIERNKKGESGILYFNRAYHKVGNRLHLRPSRVSD